MEAWVRIPLLTICFFFFCLIIFTTCRGAAGSQWGLVQSLNSPFFPPLRGWTRAGERRIQDNLHAHAQNEPIKHHQTLLGPNHAARVSVSRNTFLSSCSEKKNCSDVNIVVKNIKTEKSKYGHRGLYSYRQRVRVIRLFPNNFYVLFLHVERVCKRFWKENLTCTSSWFAQWSACTFKSESVF